MIDAPKDSHPEQKQDSEHSEADDFTKAGSWMPGYDVFGTLALRSRVRA
jgi:hypothetical protein